MSPVDSEHASQHAQHGPLRIASLVGALLMGVGLAYLAMPAIVRNITTDLVRVRTVIDGLRSPHLPVEIAVFGNSLVGDGVNARRLSKVLPSHPLALNLSVPGQSLTEAFLLYSILPESTRVIVQQLEPRTLAKTEMISPQKFNAYYMYGLHPDAQVVEKLSQILGPAMHETLTMSALRHRFLARSALRQAFDTGFRKMLRRDLKLDSAAVDLYYPRSYTRRLGEDQLQRAVSLWNERFPPERHVILDSRRQLIDALIDDATAHERSILFFVPPLHPRVRPHLRSEFLQALSDLTRTLDARPGVHAINASLLLEEEDFIDQAHPTESGAERLTDLLAEHLLEMGG